jgi:uncharacterized glyoxalase superfamily protein PhnB
MALTLLRPMLAVNDMVATIKFWTDVLGFTVKAEMSFGEGQPPGWCNLDRDGVAIMFTWEPEHTHYDGTSHGSEASLAGSIYFNVDDVDALYEELRQKPGMGEIGAPADQPHGMREFLLHDPNGFAVLFGRPL